MKLIKIQNICLYLFFISINFEVWDPFNTNGLISISKLFGYLYVLSLIPNFSKSVQTQNILIYLRPLFLFFLVLTIVNLFNLSDKYDSFLNLTIFQNILFFWFLVNHELRYKGVLNHALLFFALGSFALSLCYYFDIGVEYEQFTGRISIFGDNQNIIGIRMVVSTFILLAYLQPPFPLSKRNRLLLLLLIPLMLALLINTGSRVSFISLILGLGVIGVLHKTKGSISKIMIVFTGILMLIFLTQYALSSEVLGERLQGATNDGALTGRDTIWLQILPLIQENIFFGVGDLGYLSYSDLIFGTKLSPHNVIIEILAYTGIIGLAIYFNFLSKIVKTAYRYYRKSKRVLQLVLLVPILGMLLSGQLLGVKLGWLIFAYVASKQFNLKENKKKVLR